MYVLGEQISAQLGPQLCPGSPWGSLSPIRQLRGLWQEVQHDFPLRFSRDVLKIWQSFCVCLYVCTGMCLHICVWLFIHVEARRQQSAWVPSIYFFETKYLPSSWLQGFLCIQFSSARITTPIYLHRVRHQTQDHMLVWPALFWLTHLLSSTVTFILKYDKILFDPLLCPWSWVLTLSLSCFYNNSCVSLQSIDECQNPVVDLSHLSQYYIQIPRQIMW